MFQTSLSNPFLIGSTIIGYSAYPIQIHFFTFLPKTIPHSISWNLKIALPGISDLQSFWTTVDASSAANSVWGGGII